MLLFVTLGKESAHAASDLRLAVCCARVPELAVPELLVLLSPAVALRRRRLRTIKGTTQSICDG